MIFKIILKIQENLNYECNFLQKKRVKSFWSIILVKEHLKKSMNVFVNTGKVKENLGYLAPIL